MKVGSKIRAKKSPATPITGEKGQVTIKGLLVIYNWYILLFYKDYKFLI